jgi:2-aminoethylphosphonate-pyruvate transaminase
VYSTTKAVILAAGLGMRLRDVFTGKPKGLLTIEGISLVERSIQLLRAHGIHEIVIVTGHLAEAYEALAADYAPFVRTVHNPYYADSGSMYSLYCARTVIDAPFLLLESDLLYEARALATLLAFPAEDAMLVSGFTYSNDEMYIEARDGHFYQMSKDRSRLQSIIGEMVGISQISAALYQQMLTYAEEYFKTSRHLHYEDGCLTAIAQQHAISICHVTDLVWTEIDNADHLARAQSRIWPQIQRQEQQTELFFTP